MDKSSDHPHHDMVTAGLVKPQKCVKCVRPHWNAVKRMSRCLKGTMDQRLKLNVSKNLDLKVYSDAEWATDPKDRKSVSGMVIYLGDACVMWKSRKLIGISSSSTEAQFGSLHELSCEKNWFG